MRSGDDGGGGGGGGNVFGGSRHRVIACIGAITRIPPSECMRRK